MKKPKYLLWKERGGAYCNYKNKRYYFPGKYGSTESREAFEKFLTSIERGDFAPNADAPLTVAELCSRFLSFAKTYYRKHGRSTGSYERFAQFVVPPLLDVAHKKAANDFSRADLRAARDLLVARKLCLTTVNDRVRFMKQIFKWGAENDFVDEGVPFRLALVKPLESGRSAARDPEPVVPVSDDDIRLTAAHLSAVVADMVFVMRYSAMRPGEIFRLRWRDVDRSGPIWIYRPAEYKTEHAKRRRPRVVPLAAGVRDVLEKYRAKKDDEPIFSPGDAARERFPNSRRQYAPTYNKDSFRTAIARAAKRAGVPPWSPNRLRHSAATEIRRLAGLDAAQVILGHASAKTTEIYAETDVERAVAAAELVWGAARQNAVDD